MILKHMGEYFCLLCWFPNKFKFLVFDSLILLGFIHSSKKHSVIAKLCKNSRISLRMTKIIYTPPNFWNGINSEFFQYELVPYHHIYNHFLISVAGFVMSCPSSIYEFQLIVFNYFPNFSLLIIILFIPPHFKIFKFRP